MLRQRSLLAIPLLASLLWGQHRPAKTDVRLLFTGDILLSRQVEAQMKLRRLSPWTNLQKLFAEADWVGGNLEGAIGSPSQCLSSKNCFATPPSVASVLKRAGFRALTVENNHSGDLGTAGRELTRSSLTDAGLLPLDFDSSPQFLRLGDTTIGVIAITTVQAADGRVQAIPSVELAQKLRTARRLASLVIVSIHWGGELVDWPSETQRTQAAWLVDHGADVILGHHPHVVQAPECIGGKPVFFSLGNHVFDQKYLDAKEGMIADCRIRQGRLSCGSILTHVDPGNYLPGVVAPAPNSSSGIANCFVTLSPSLELGGYEIRPQPWSPDAPNKGVALTGWKGGALKWRTRRQALVSLDPGKLAGPSKETLLFTLERHASSLDHEESLRPYVYSISSHGLVARWRGSALAWPLLDATVDQNSGTVCALHRGDSFIFLGSDKGKTRTALYRWNGFGFSGLEDETLSTRCSQSAR